MNQSPTVHPVHLPPPFRHLWIFFVVIGLLNCFLLVWRFKRLSAERPELAAGYRKYLVGYAVFMLIPWLVMGFGIEVGGVPHIFSFLRPVGHNPSLIAFDAVWTLILALYCVWMYFYRGAEFLIAHPGTLGRGMPPDPARLRSYAAFALAVWLIMLVLRWNHFLPALPIL